MSKKRDENIGKLCQAWFDAFGDTPTSVATALTVAPRIPALAQAIHALTHMASNRGMSLGQTLRQARLKGEPLGGFYIVNDISHGPHAAWRMVRATEAKPAQPQTASFPAIPGYEEADEVVRRLTEGAAAARAVTSQRVDASAPSKSNVPKTSPPVENRVRRTIRAANSLRASLTDSDMDQLHEDLRPTQPSPSSSTSSSSSSSSLNELPISLADVRNACLADQRTWHLDIKTGQICSKPSESSVIIPPAQKRIRYAWIQDFIETFDDDAMKDIFRRAIDGEHAFRRFRVAASQYGKTKSWHAFQTAKLNNYIDEWLQLLGVKRVKGEEKEEEKIDEPISKAALQVILFRGLEAEFINAVQAHQLLSLLDAE